MNVFFVMCHVNEASIELSEESLGFKGDSTNSNAEACNHLKDLTGSGRDCITVVQQPLETSFGKDVYI